MTMDHSQTPLLRAVQSLRGLALGDSLGRALVARGTGGFELGALPWIYTDDTVMALSIVEQLGAHGRILEDDLAAAFGRRFLEEPERGYGAVAFWLLSKISAGGPWRELAAQPFGGEGSRGNGAAMRAAPIGAYFSHDLKAVIEQTTASARVTHAHPDGQAGAIAVAVATAIASTPEPPTPRAFLELILDQTPVGPTRQGIARAISLLDAEPAEAAQALGTGIDVLSSDTVPFALWVVAQHCRDFSTAMTCALSAVPSADSDVDTLGAIVGGIVAMAASPSTIPESWSASCEALPLDFLNETN
jgi:ADP-ribosylglycohydrolase